MTRRLIKLMTLTTIVLAAIAVSSSCVSSPDLYASAESHRLQAEILANAITASAQAPIIHITETAAAMQIQAIQAQGTATSAALTQASAMTATAAWWTPTPNFGGTQTSAAISAQGTTIANAAIRDQLALQREIQNNEWNRLAGPIGATAAAGLIIVLVVTYLRRTRYQFARTDERGNVLPLIDIVEGSFTDMDRSPNHRGPVSNGILIRILTHIMEQKFGMPRQLPDVTAGRQDLVTERDQMIDLASRGLPVPSPENKKIKELAGQQLVRQATDANLASRFKILGDPDKEPAIDSTIIDVLDQDWKEAVNP